MILPSGAFTAPIRYPHGERDRQLISTTWASIANTPCTTRELDTNNGTLWVLVCGDSARAGVTMPRRCTSSAHSARGQSRRGGWLPTTDTHSHRCAGIPELVLPWI